MQVHEIKFKLKERKRVGRGGKKGSYSGRGIKGQKARAGHKIRPALRDLILRLPKKRGWHNLKLEKNIFVVNLDQINEKFNEGEIVNLTTLKEKNILKIPKSFKNIEIKILGKGQLNKKLIFDSSLKFSKKAKEKIQKSLSEIK
jgi:large subunit ribosomal protein L15